MPRAWRAAWPVILAATACSLRRGPAAALGRGGPRESEAAIHEELETWCRRSRKDNLAYAKLTQEKFTAADNLAKKCKWELNRIEEEKRNQLKRVEGDPMAGIDLQQSAEFRNLSRQAIEANSRFLAARSSRHQWLTCKGTIDSIDATVASVCGKAEALHEDFQKKSKELVLVRLRGGAAHAASLRNITGQPVQAGIPSTALLRAKLQRTTPGEAKDKLVEALKNRRETLEKRLVWCNAQRAAARDAQAARDQMITRTKFEREMHEKAIGKIERKMSEFSGMCQDLAADGKDFADLATSEKVEYARLAEGAGPFGPLLDAGHQAWMGFRGMVGGAYNDIDKKCAQLGEIMKMRTISRQEQVDRLNDGTDQYGTDDPPKLCKTDSELQDQIDQVNADLDRVENPWWL